MSVMGRFLLTMRRWNHQILGLTWSDTVDSDPDVLFGGTAAEPNHGVLAGAVG